MTSLPENIIHSEGKLPYSSKSLLPYIESLQYNGASCPLAIKAYEGDKRLDFTGVTCCFGTARVYEDIEAKENEIDQGMLFLSRLFVKRVDQGYIKKATTDVHLVDVGGSKVVLIMGITSDHPKHKLLKLDAEDKFFNP